jgi:hypothetical protein
MIGLDRGWQGRYPFSSIAYTNQEVGRTNHQTGETDVNIEDLFTDKPITALEERQGLLAHHVRLVARKLNHALFVFGSQGGLGKSRTILRTLDDEGIEPILINSHITPLAL